MTSEPSRGASRGGDANAKAARCAAVRCPLAGMGDERCAKCTGPVAWTDEGGRRVGMGGKRRRKCSSCPMDGLGLPVCWAGCDGPPDISTDGESIVRLGAMVGQEGEDKYIHARIARAPDLGGDAYGGMARGFVSALLRLDGKAWAELADACSRRDAKAAAALMGVPLNMFRGRDGGWDESMADRVMARIGGLDGTTWDMVRGLLSGLSQQGVARRGFVSRQAVNKRLCKMASRWKWLERLLEDL